MSYWAELPSWWWSIIWDQAWGVKDALALTDKNFMDAIRGDEDDVLSKIVKLLTPQVIESISNQNLKKEIKDIVDESIDILDKLDKLKIED